MTNKSRYVFGAAVASVALGAIPGMMKKAQAAPIVIADFSFEAPNAFFPTSGTSSATSGSYYLYSSYTAASVGPILADTGIGSAIGVHASSATVWSAPVGNGSAKSLSANHWASGDYYQFTVSTAALLDVLVSFDQVSSSTGPHAFVLQYSDDQTTGTVAYTVGTGSFSASPANTAASFGFDLSSITGLDNDAAVTFKLIESDTTTATGGTDRVDNFVVSGSTVAVPEPASLSLLTVAGAAALYRKRRPQA